LIRTDTTFRFLGLSRNAWVALGLGIAGAVMFWWLRDRGDDDEASTVETTDALEGGEEE